MTKAHPIKGRVVTGYERLCLVFGRFGV